MRSETSDAKPLFSNTPLAIRALSRLQFEGTKQQLGEKKAGDKVFVYCSKRVPDAAELNGAGRRSFAKKKQIQNETRHVGKIIQSVPFRCHPTVDHRLGLDRRLFPRFGLFF